MNKHGTRRVALKAPREVSIDELTHGGVIGRSFVLPVPVGFYASTPTWGTEDSWLAAVRGFLATESGEQLRRALQVAGESVILIAGVLARYADRRTGRGVAAANATIAAVATTAGRKAISAKVVQRTERFLEEAGLLAIGARGRKLNGREIAYLREQFGINQDRAANVRALTLPREAFVHLPVNTPDQSSSSVPETHNKPRRRQTTAPRPWARKKSTRPKPKPTTPVIPLSERPAAFRRLVAKLDAGVIGRDGRVRGRFSQGRSIMWVVRLLDEYGVNPSWDPDELLHTHLRWTPDTRLRDGHGLGWLRKQLSRWTGRPMSQDQIPPLPPEFAGDVFCETQWATDKQWRDGQLALIALRASEDNSPTSAPTPGGAGSHLQEPEARRRSKPTWLIDQEAAQARVEAEGDAAFVAGITLARAAA